MDVFKRVFDAPTQLLGVLAIWRIELDETTTTG